MTRVVTYDVRSGHDYTDFYEFVEKHNGAQLTESTYAINTSYNLKQFEAQLKLLFRRGDSIYIFRSIATVIVYFIKNYSLNS